jgi:sulfate transport system permease protein
VAKWGLRLVAIAYLALLLVIPLGIIVQRTFEDGAGKVWDSLRDPLAVHAFQVTLQVAFWAVLLNTIFGVGAALLIVRYDFPGKRIFNALIDLPLAVSPVVVGLALILVYGRLTTVGSWFGDQGIDIIFALPGMVLATAFVSLPLMVREVVPVLEEIGIEQEQAAWTLGASGWQTFRRVTFPAIRWAVAYGLVLTLARSLGEFGAVAVVSGRVVGKTQTITLYVQQHFENFDKTGAYAASLALAGIAVVVLVIMNLLRPKEDR